MAGANRGAGVGRDHAVLVRVSLAIGTAWAAALALNRALRRVTGGSMAPTLAPDDVVLTLPLRRPRRGEVVLLRDPRQDDREQLKRVVGLPGESVRIHRGRLVVDGDGHVEPYASGRGPAGRLSVPEDHVVVLGDARAASTDSRVYGPVPLALVDARVVARVWPRPRLLRSRPRRLTLTAETDEQRGVA